MAERALSIGARQQAGARGEAIAAAHLEGLGYEIIARNQRTRWGEIDLIARLGDRLCIVEVKSWRGSRFGGPEQWVSPRKLARLSKLAEAWIARVGPPFETVTLGVVAISWQAGVPEVHFLDSVF